MTLSSVEVDLAGCFEPGHAYVALSRCVSLESTRLLTFRPDKIFTDKKVLCTLPLPYPPPLTLPLPPTPYPPPYLPPPPRTPSPTPTPHPHPKRCAPSTMRLSDPMGRRLPR